MTDDPKSPRKNAPVEPVGAATILLIRDSAEGVEVFMVVRHREIDFASGALVFPGGEVDPGDHDPALRDRAGASRDLTDDAFALRVAAIRETFEEASVLLARPRGGAALIDADRLAQIVTRHRAALHGGDITLREILEAEDMDLACDLLTPFSHWITPEAQRRRFDTHFFLAPAPSRLAARHDGVESVDSIWIRPSIALEDAEAERRTVVFPTRMNLGVLGRSQTVAEAIQAARDTPIVTVLPKVRQVEGGRILQIPEEAGYGISEIFIQYTAS